MKQIRMLAQYYVDLMMKLGLVRFFRCCWLLRWWCWPSWYRWRLPWCCMARLKVIDVIRSIFFGLLITPWAVYFLSVVVEQPRRVPSASFAAGGQAGGDA
ncbi:hypothetical protein LNP74_09410 [Klebsiella pneumoniae subsp. pneumoniae]|nr:hypothetical protein [Klebsiella pneumoniae subsp. pneumoniae]